MFATSNFQQQKPAQQTQKQRYFQLDQPALKQYYHNQYKFKLITAAGYILNLLKIHRKHSTWSWVINKLEFCQRFGIAVRTFDRAIAHLRQAKLIRQEGQGKRITLWWNQVRDVDFDSAPTMAQAAPTMAQAAPTMAQAAPTMAQESFETIEDIEFQESPILSSDFYYILSSEGEEVEGVANEGVEEVEQRISYEDEIEQEGSQEQLSSHEEPSSAPPEALVEKVDPREAWLRSVKLPGLPNAPNDPNAWVRSQLKPENWHKYESAYAAQQASAPQYEQAPDGLDAKIAFLRAAGALVGTRHEGTRLIVSVNSQSLSAVEFMNAPNEQFVDQKTFSISDVLKAFKSQKRSPAAEE